MPLGMNVLKLKLFFIELAAKRGVISKKTHVDINELPIISLPTKNGIANYSTSGNVYKIEINGNSYYFRICRKHDPIGEFVNNLIDDYSFQRNVVYLKGVKDLVQDRSVLIPFANMGSITDESSGVYKYFSTGNVKYLGLPQDYTIECDRRQFDVFVNYIWSELHPYYVNKKSGNYHLFNYNRAKAQDVLYSYFGVNNLICPIDLVMLKGEKDWVGTLMPEAKGINPKEIKKGEIEHFLSPVIVRDLTTLNFMDVLCYEGDHRPGNYMVVLDELGKGVSIQAFDNDSSIDFFPFPTVSKRICGSEPFVKNGFINRAHLDKDFANKVLSTDNGEVVAILKPYLTKAQLVFLKIRFRKLKNALRNTIANRPDFLLENNEWSSLSLYEDLSYGTTYYTVLRDWYEGDKDLVLLQQEKQPLCIVSF